MQRGVSEVQSVGFRTQSAHGFLDNKLRESVSGDFNCVVVCLGVDIFVYVGCVRGSGHAEKWGPVDRHDREVGWQELAFEDRFRRRDHREMGGGERHRFLAAAKRAVAQWSSRLRQRNH